mmetsp:Transcript_64642/g.204069  ORF Transcript_64642/g.204069 Transcript_64642/m.204069 type:complete len:200 (-) Transcript_64642:38-637(-)
MVPAMEAASVSFTDLPAMKRPPPLENWMIMGDLALAAASRHEQMREEEVTFTAGMANSLSRANARRVMRSSPVTTPGLILVMSSSLVMAAAEMVALVVTRRVAWTLAWAATDLPEAILRPDTRPVRTGANTALALALAAVALTGATRAMVDMLARVAAMVMGWCVASDAVRRSGGWRSLILAEEPAPQLRSLQPESIPR